MAVWCPAPVPGFLQSAPTHRSGAIQRLWRKGNYNQAQYGWMPDSGKPGIQPFPTPVSRHWPARNRKRSRKAGLQPDQYCFFVPEAPVPVIYQGAVFALNDRVFRHLESVIVWIIRRAWPIGRRTLHGTSPSGPQGREGLLAKEENRQEQGDCEERIFFHGKNI